MSLKLKEQETRQCAKGGEICRGVGSGLGGTMGPGAEGPMPPPQILTDHLTLYLNQGRQITLTILLITPRPTEFLDFPTALNMLVCLWGLTDLSLQNILPTIIKRFFCITNE